MNFRRRTSSIVAMAVVFVFLFTAVAGAALPSKIYYEDSAGNIVKADYEIATDEMVGGNTSMMLAIKAGLVYAQDNFKKAIIELVDGKVIDWEKALDNFVSFTEAQEVDTYDTTVPEATKELNTSGDIVDPEIPGEVDKIALSERISEVAALDESEYTVESWAAMQEALTAAEEVAANDEATQEEVDSALTELSDAIGALVEKDVGRRVVEVSAINANYVVVKITAPEEDLLAQEVEVKNGAGVVVAVKPLDIAAGDVTAEFEFVTAVKAADLKGVWTVNGKSYDLDLFNNLSAFLNAGDQLALNEALTDLGIANVKVENMPAYFTAKGNITKTAEELTVADVQKLVDDVNAKAISADDEAAIVKAVTDAQKAGNEVALLQALQNKAFVRVNPEWVSEPTNGYMVKILGTETKIADIQTVINTSNDTILKAAGTLETTGIDKAKLTASKALIKDWATVDKDGKITDGTIKTYPALIDIQLAVADVVGATTPTALKAKLTVLAELDKANLDMKNYIDANGKAYVEALKAKADGDKDTTTKISNILFAASTGVNDVEAAKLVTAVKTAAAGTDADALLKALNDLGLKQVAASNKDAYHAEVDFKTIADKAAGQTAVDKVNVAVLSTMTDADELLEALKVLELKNIVDANKDAYLTGKATLVTDAATVKTAIDTINQTVAENAQLKVINEAETVAEVKSALDELANVDKVADYLVIRSVDRDFVAAHVLDKRPATVGYVNVGAVETEVTNAKTAHTGALTAINALKLTDTPDTVVTALDKVLDEDFAALSNVEKVNAAEAFQAQLTFKADGTLETPFITLADVKALL